MSIYLWHCYSAVRATWKLLVEGASKVFSGIFPLFFKTFSSNPYKPNDLESNDTVDATSKTLDCVAYTLHPIFQSDLKIVGIGASGQVYEVDEEIVLKSCRLFKQPGSDASDNDRYHYASDTIFLSGLLQDERLVLRLLQKWPHPHIIEAIDTDQVEGIFLRRYQTLPEGAMTTQPTRIRWYREITDALCHIHKLGIAHADIRIDNILLDSQGSAIICDFSAASPFGQPNLVILDLPLPVNGPSPTLSEATDMFAMGSLIFQVEHGIKPGFSVDTDGELVLPEIHTGHQGIDVIIRNAWLGHYSRTSEMLESLRSLDSQISQGVLDTQNTQTHPVPTAALKERIRRWRENRERNNGCVLDGMLSERQLQVLADSYGLNRDAESRFASYHVSYFTHDAQLDLKSAIDWQ